MGYKYLFGPVPSRRLGSSLGVDLIPHKVCSLNCVYCECGETKRLTTVRDEYVPFSSVTAELDHFLGNRPRPDFVTFSGYGEPTLHSRLGDVIAHLKAGNHEVKIAVLTNGTLLTDPQVRQELMSADIVLPSLDAVSADEFRAINRPCPELDVNSHIRGLVDFSKEFKGEVWLEVFILPGFNDSPDHLEKLRQTIASIRPTRVQLNTLDRPGVLSDLRPAGPELLNHLLEEWQLPGLEIIAAVNSRKEKKAFREDIEQAIVETIARRPCTLEDLGMILNLHSNETNKYLSSLAAEGRIETVEMERGVFYQLKKRE